jgi:hypothetical protein
MRRDSMAGPDETPQGTSQPDAAEPHGETDSAPDAPDVVAEIGVAHEEPSPAAILIVRRYLERETVAFVTRFWRAAYPFRKKP